MGLEIDREEFEDSDYRRFGERLERSLDVLAALLEQPGFGAGDATLGAELEVSLVDTMGRPLPQNSAVLAESMDPRLTVELDRFNLESNLRYGPLRGRPFEALAGEMDDALTEMSRAAALHGAHIAMIGILPTLTQADLRSEAMTDTPRYRALSASLRRLRQEPFRLDIHGEDGLELPCDDVTYEGAATSLQVHLRVAPGDFAGIYNAVQWTTPVVLALGANSPTFLGRRLWDETRVALFKQAVDPRPPGARASLPSRVSFGTDWIHGPVELFRDCVGRHPVLLPILGAEDPAAALDAGGVPALHELRLHQGTIWGWNRPIYDPASGGHLRIELRALPSGPTVEDMVASTAFHLGLALDVARELGDGPPEASFAEVHADFYRAAREGLEARLLPPGAAPGSGRAEVRAFGEALLARAQAGLDAAGVERADSEPRLAAIERRLRSGVTGARWQRRALAAAERSLPRDEAIRAMFARYLALAAEAAPVADWPEGGA
jgi:gamma-glutamyl:cysteine ligase YbdK (ATP-grasp superfamily)